MASLVPRSLLPHLLIPLGVAALLAIIGPFGTFADMSFGARLVYWGVIVPLNWLQVELIARALVPRLPARLPAGAGIVASALLASVPATAEVAVLERMLRPGALDHPLWRLYGWVALLTVGIALAVWSSRLPLHRPPEGAVPPSAAEPPFLRRIPPKLGRELLCLKTEDHYLRVYTTKGDDLILMRLRDAEAELADAEGMRVHRSWWVARRAVRDVRRDGERVVLELVNGLDVPVSRSYVATLRAAGWLG